MLAEVYAVVKKKAQIYLLKYLNRPTLPKHIAFIMDGNRRFALQRQLKKEAGHSFGFEKLQQVLEWCMALDIKELSVYAFSVDNFKREKSEVQVLMDLCVDKMKELLKEESLLHEYKVKVNIVGEKALLPKYVLDVCDELERKTQSYSNKILNICMPYSSTLEMLNSLKQMEKGNELAADLEEYEESENNFNSAESELESRFKQGLYLKTKLDLVIRTSGEHRLSDFMMYQVCEGAVIEFSSLLWPEFSFMEYFFILVKYQNRKINWFGLYA